MDVIDFHAHVLPGADHGSRNLEIALRQLRIAAENGTTAIVATPHFEPQNETIAHFLSRRERAAEALLPHLTKDMPRVYLGAEVLLCPNMQNMPELSRLAIEGTDVILLERPFLPLDRMCGVARLIGDPERVIRRVAVCTGSGSSLLEDAARAGADLFITGDMKYHDALALHSRQNGNSSNFCPMSILDIGHFSLEEEMMRRFALQLEKELDGVTVTFLPGRDPFQPLTFLSEVPEVLS